MSRNARTAPWSRAYWTTRGLDEVRRQVWNQVRHSGDHAHACRLKRTRYSLWKNLENLTDKQLRKLAWVERLNRPLFRAHPLKGHLVRHEAHVDRVDRDVHHQPVAAGRRSCGQPEP